ncbi:MAG TPA: DUF4178 domain-containing protein [Pyrinomonadaceae bacterium]|jgi:hypothetical protein
MSNVLEANCPACGAGVVFKNGSSVVVVCEYCNSAIARTDRALEDLGRVAEIVESGSPLALGMRGVLRGVAFELTGRAQLRHAAGGMWDEWYAAFADGRWGWLAEAQGRFYLTYQAPRSVTPPPFALLELGQPVKGIPVSVPLMVAEKGEAAVLGAEGEIPYRLTPGERYEYADLSGQGGVFGTIDYGEEPPLVYVGRETTLDELGIITVAAPAREREPRRVGATQLQCPQCAGPLELRAPDKTERVGCPNCGSLLDVNQGQLKFLKSLEPGKFKPTLPIGSVVNLRDLLAASSSGANGKAADEKKNGERSSDGAETKLTIIGWMVRSVEFEGVRYFWEEYLLYHPRVGFRWLVQSDNHWSYVEAVPPGDVTDMGSKARLGGKDFKVFQDAVARVEHVAGEFYWKVETGELVRAVDYVRAPEMLSKEASGMFAPAHSSDSLTASEINWSRGTYVPYKNIERLFNVELARPTTIAPNQPFRHKAIYKYWLLLIFITTLIGVASMITRSERRVFEQTYRMQPPAVATPTPIRLPNGRTLNVPSASQMLQNMNGYDGTQVIFSEPFELRDRENVKLTAEANVDNSWLYVEGDLINEATGLVQQFELPIEYYYGTEGGETWSEGDRSRSAYLSALPAGTYTMRLEAQWEKWKGAEPPQLRIQMSQGAPRVLNLVLAIIALSLIPLFVLIYQFSFEKRRWADSAFNPYDSDSSDDE